MDNYGFLRVAAATPLVHVANAKENAAEIVRLALEAENIEASFLVFPELSLSGYTCGDLFTQEKLLIDVENATKEILEQTADCETVLVFGVPLRYRGRLYDCAIVARHGNILGIVPKSYVSPNEQRWFSSAKSLEDKLINVDYAGQDEISFGPGLIFSMGRCDYSVEIGHDLEAPVPLCTAAALSGAQLILNLSAVPEELKSYEHKCNLVSATSSRLLCAYVYSSCGYGESTQDQVWAGASLIAERGEVLAENERYSLSSRLIAADVDIQKLEKERSKNALFAQDAVSPEYVVVDEAGERKCDFESDLIRYIDPYPFIPENPVELSERCSEILNIQVNALCTRMRHIRSRKAVLGVSGGLDSTLALIVTALAFDKLGLPRENIIGVTMPGFGTSKRTHSNSDTIMKEFGIDSREISIVPAVRQHFSDLGHDENVHDLTYENSQARERTQILMDLAGKEGGIVVGTGDLSELALGWCTYNGDHMSMYCVNGGVPKSLIRSLVAWAAENIYNEQEGLKAVLLDIADTPISPELLPTDENGKIAQKTEDLVGPYELHDFFIYNFMRWGFAPEKILFLAKKAFKDYGEDVIRHWLEIFLRRFFTQQFKRSCSPDGPKVGSVSLSPRGSWLMPSDMESYWKISSK